MKTLATALKVAAVIALIPAAAVVLSQLFAGAPLLMLAATLVTVVVGALIACEIANG